MQSIQIVYLRPLGSEEAKRASGHRTNKAFGRYNQAINDGAFQVVSKIRERMTGKVISMDEKRRIR